MVARRVSIAFVLLFVLGLAAVLCWPRGADPQPRMRSEGTPEPAEEVMPAAPDGVVPATEREAAPRATAAAMVGPRAVVRDAALRAVAGVVVVAVFAPVGSADAARRVPLAASDANGDVSLAPLTELGAQIEPRGTQRPVRVGVELPGIDVGVLVDAAQLPREPVVLALPATGAIEVRAHDAIGRPQAIAVGLVLADDAAAEPSEAATDAHGDARYAHVGLGKSWRVGRVHTDPRQWLDVAGPTQAGECVVVTMQPPPGPTLRGRLWRDGAPLANCALTIEIDGEPGGVYPESTDADGSFRAAIARHWLGAHSERIDVRAGRSPARARWRGAHDWQLGDFDVGDLHLVAEPLLVAGRLVAPEGAGADDAKVLVQRFVGGERGWDWCAVDGARRPDGAFEFFGEPPAPALRLVVLARGFAPFDPRPFVAGERDVQLVLERGGSVVATAVVPSREVGIALEALLVPDVPSPAYEPWLPFNAFADPRTARREFDDDGVLRVQWTWPAMRAGRYRLDVWSRGLRRPIAVVDGVFVVAGQPTADARLRDLDIGAIDAVIVRVPQAALARDAWPRGVVAVLDGDAVGPRFVQLDGEVACFAAAAPLDLLVRVPGCRDRVLRRVKGEQRVELEPGIPVTVHLRAAPDGAACALVPCDDPLLAANATLDSPAAGGVPAHGFYRDVEWPGRADDGGFTFALPRAGDYTVVVRGAGPQTAAIACEPATLTVGVDGGTFAVTRR